MRPDYTLDIRQHVMSSERHRDSQVESRLNSQTPGHRHIENKEPASMHSRKDFKCFGNSLRRLPEQLYNGGKVTLSGGRLIDVDPEYAPKAAGFSQDSVKIS